MDVSLQGLLQRLRISRRKAVAVVAVLQEGIAVGPQNQYVPRCRQRQDKSSQQQQNDFGN